MTRHSVLVWFKQITVCATLSLLQTLLHHTIRKLDGLAVIVAWSGICTHSYWLLIEYLGLRLVWFIVDETNPDCICELEYREISGSACLTSLSNATNFSWCWISAFTNAGIRFSSLWRHEQTLKSHISAALCCAPILVWVAEPGYLFSERKESWNESARRGRVRAPDFLTVRDC